MPKRKPDIAHWAWCAAAFVAVAAAAWLAAERFTYLHPALLSACVLLPFAAWLNSWRNDRRASLTRLSTLSAHLGGRLGWKPIAKPAPLAFALAGSGLLIIALARPQSHDTREDVHQEGIDIMIAMDISVSMLAKDLKPDRLDAAKRTGTRFIKARPTDRIGLVVYEGEAFTACPLTTDHDVLIGLLNESRSGLIDGGTAVGMGLATAVNRLRESAAKSKVVILLTDGVHNAGEIDPLTAAEAAKALGVKVYTIGAAKPGQVPVPVQDLFGDTQIAYQESQIDEQVLRQVADITGGRYFRAEDTRDLQAIYDAIDKLEKSQVEVQVFNRYQELAGWLMVPALLVLLVELALSQTVFRRLP